jgi:hypothetical protein
VSVTTVWRWATRGVRARNGLIVKLETIKLGGTTCTSDEALARFFQALTDGVVRPATPVESRCGPGAAPNETGA